MQVKVILGERSKRFADYRSKFFSTDCYKYCKHLTAER